MKGTRIVYRIVVFTLALVGAWTVFAPLIRTALLDTRIYSRVPSPTGDLELHLQVVSAGSATRSLRRVFLVGEGHDIGRGEMILEVYGGGKLDAIWDGPRHLAIKVPGSASVGLARTRVSRYGVSIVLVAGEP